jgi:RluA family pseudouridine synthase
LKRQIKDRLNNQILVLIPKNVATSDKSFSKKRLHKAVADHIKENQIENYSNPEIQKNILNFGVGVDGVLNYNRMQWIQSWQNVDISHWKQRPKASFEDIKEIFENKQILVLFKPYGLPVQEGTGHRTDNLVFWLTQNYPEQLEILKGKTTAGLVHRLDINTQGIIIVAKNQLSLEFLQSQFKQRRVIKKYLAVVNGFFDFEGKITHYQTRDKSNPIKQKLFWDKDRALLYDNSFREAVSIINPLAYWKVGDEGQTLVEIQIKTGRMHQIRVLMESLGHPLSNDTTYFKKNNSCFKNTLQKIELQKLNLAQFSKLKETIFGVYNYCLLANYIELEVLGDDNKPFVSCFELVNMQKLLSEV